MRLRRLDLIRYGRFEGRDLDFGPAPEDGPDLALVYGANEAGKSTAFAAWLDLLFGIPLQTDYAFRHARKDLLIGAEIDTADGPLTLRRTGKRQGALTDGSGNAIADHRIAALLHGLDRDGYRLRFSIDEGVLREGGAEIAKAHGDLGQLLHAGTSGLSGLADALAQIEGEVERVHRKSARKSLLAEGKAELREIETRIAAARLSETRFAQLRDARDAALREVGQCAEALDAARRALSLRDAAETRREHARRLDEIAQRLAEMPEGPDLPPDAVAEIVAADTERSTATQARARAEAERDAAAEALKGLPEDAEGAEIAAMLDDLRERLFDDGTKLLARAAVDEADLPRRREQRGARAEEIAALAALLADGEDRVAEPAALVLSPGAADALRQAAGDARDATRARDELTEQLAEAEAALPEATDPPAGLTRLEQARAAWDRHLPDLAGLAEAARAHAAHAGLAATGLPPCWAALVAAGLPEPAELGAIADAVAKTGHALETAGAQLAEAEEAQARAEDAVAAARVAPDSVTDDEIADSRAARDTAWQVHRTDLDAASADRFEQVMRRDDARRDSYLRGAAARMGLAEAERQVALASGLATRRRDATAEAKARADSARETLSAAAVRLGLSGDGPAAALRPRCDALAAAARAAQEAEAAEARLREAKGRADALAGAVRDALAAAGIEAPDDRAALPAEADAALARLRAQDAAATEYRARSAALADLRRRHAASLRRAETAQEALARCAAGTPCAGLAPEAVPDRLARLSDLAEALRTLTGLDHRIAEMERAGDLCRAAAEPLRRALGLAEDTPVAMLERAAGQRAEAARARAEARAKQTRLREDAAQRFAEAEDVIAASGATIAALLAGQRVETDAPRLAVATLEARDRLRAEARGLQAERARLALGHDPGALAAEDARDDPVRRAALADELSACEAARDTAQHAAGAAAEALDAALRAEGAADALQARETVLAELSERVPDALARQFGLMAARTALRRFRAESRSAMLQATEAAFLHMTAGDWDGLATEPDGTSERLVGRRDGRVVQIDEMSTGTQGQLYLALRIAGHHDFVARAGPLPFVTDDVHETFDDGRARAALELSAEMGRRGQAIVFTHHRHLVEMARDLVPGLRVLELG